MRLSNTWRKLGRAASGAFGIVVVLYSAYQLYCAATQGMVSNLSRGDRNWITFQSNRGDYIFSIVLYGVVVAMAIAALVATLVGWRNDRIAILRNRSKTVFDDAIRLDLDSR